MTLEYWKKMAEHWQKRADWLDWHITMLQKALGWQISLEKVERNGKNYDTVLIIRLRFTGKVWPLIIVDRKYRCVLHDMVKHKLYKVLEEERRKLQTKDTPPTIHLEL